MTCNFTSFLTVYQLYQDDGWMIIRDLGDAESCIPGCEKIGLEADSSRPRIPADA